jgi:hypothetical protein
MCTKRRNKCDIFEFANDWSRKSMRNKIYGHRVLYQCQVTSHSFIKPQLKTSRRHAEQSD